MIATNILTIFIVKMPSDLAAEHSGVQIQVSAGQWCSIIISTFRETAENVSLSSDSDSGVLNFPLSALTYVVPNTGKIIKLKFGRVKKDNRTITVNVTNFYICANYKKEQNIEKRRFKRYPINVYKFLKTECEEDGTKLYLVLLSVRTRGNGHKVKERRFPLNIREFLLYRGLSTGTTSSKSLWSVSP